jgi:hypothetical protein
MRNAIAVENSQVHQIIAKNMGDDRSERLSQCDRQSEDWS